MGATAIPWPQKQRELHNPHFDSTIRNDFAFRDEDIIIATYGKSGTTWVQQVVGQLLFNGAEDVSVAELSPWLDLRVPPKDVKLSAIEAQTPPPLPEDASSHRCARVLALRQIHLYRPRRTRRDLQHV